ncbi:MAG: PEGA domain-containing protein, partial [Nitrospirae bacterium]|nr:PEGA domain-containing protein [Nitrospirota bacterium]
MELLNIVAIVIILLGVVTIVIEFIFFLNNRSTLIIQCDQEEAPVYVNGNLQGKSHIETKIAPGSHNISVHKDLNDGSYYTYEGVVNVGKGVEKRLEIRLERKYTEQYFWGKAKNSNNKADFDDYLERFPEGKFEAEAKAAIEELYHNNITGLQSCAEYLKVYPFGKYAKEVKAKMEELTFALCDTVAGCKRYIDKYPNGIYIGDPKLKRVKKMLSTARYNPARTLDGHKGGINCIVSTGDKFYSCSDDKTIIIWDGSYFNKLRILEAHKDGVSALAISGYTLVSASEDKSVIVWNLQENPPVVQHTLTGHGSWVTCVTIVDNFIVSGSEDKTLKVWSLETGELIRTLEGHRLGVWSVAVADGMI